VNFQLSSFSPLCEKAAQISRNVQSCGVGWGGGEVVKLSAKSAAQPWWLQLQEGREICKQIL